MAESFNKISDALRESMRVKGIGPQRLSSLTDVPRRFIDAILQGDFEKLPARPYIRGYLFKISNVLDVDDDSLWQSYRASTETMSSGDKDKLPINRFAIKHMSSGKIMAVLLGVLIVLFLALNINRIIGRPTLDVIVPESTAEKVISIEGRVNPDDRLTLNGELIYTDEEGSFEKQVQLEPGLNTLEFRIKRYLGREASIVKQVIYEPTDMPKPVAEESLKEQNGY